MTSAPIPQRAAETVADKLAEARALIERGWCRNEYACRGHVCTMGALNTVYSGDPEFGADPRALRFIRDAIGTDMILHWNDRQRSKKPVIEAFKRAEQIAREEMSL